jgi:SAM-dependent methyltransferase
MSKLAAARPADVNLRSGPQMREYLAIADRIASDQPGRVLDWGCGYGQLSHLLRERGVDVTSFDYRPNHAGPPAVESLERYGLEVHVSGDQVAVPFSDGEFDAVLSLGVLEHVQYPERSLDELHRVLKPGGTLYVYKLPNRWSWTERLARLLGLYYHGKLEFDTLYTVRETRALLMRHGYEVREVRLANMLPLTIDARWATRFSSAIWALNRILSRVPGLRLLATNVEAVAISRAPGARHR